MDSFQILLKEIQTQIPIETLYITFTVLMFVDIVTGYIKAWKNNNFKSRTMRDGMFASLGDLIVLFLCISAAKYIPITTIAVFGVVIFMVVKELYSVLENLIEIGVKLPSWLVKGLQVYQEKLDNSDIFDEKEDK